jgi:DNA mismatch repair ATPase MutS
MVQFFLSHPDLISQVRTRLGKCIDLERSIQKLHLGSAGPVDLVAIHNSLSEISKLGAELKAYAKLTRILVKKRGELFEKIVASLSFNQKILTICNGLIAEDALTSTRIVSSGVIGIYLFCLLQPSRRSIYKTRFSLISPSNPRRRIRRAGSHTC